MQVYRLKHQLLVLQWDLIKEGDDYSILSDILGDEDHLGDMDFKVAGTRRWNYFSSNGYQDYRNHI